MRAFVICRDRVTYARRCVDALRERGLKVVVVDHGSTWPPMLDWLTSPSLPPGVRTWACSNRHPRDLWAPGGAIERHVESGEPFIVTDCDVVPDDNCPTDWVGWMRTTLDRYPALKKVGLGLRTDDLPPWHAHRDLIRRWEAQYQPVDVGGRLTPVEDGRGVIADIDTTLAMYRWFEPFTLGPAMRLRAPYVARHLPWYEDTLHLDAEHQYYRDHAVHGHWRDPGNYADDHGLRNGS